MNAPDFSVKKKKTSKIASFAFWLALLMIIAAVLSGFGHRFGWWDLGSAFFILRWSVYGAIAALLLSVIGVFLSRPGRSRRGLASALGGLLLAVILLGFVGNYIRIARSVPPIHDISTDTENPPAFVALLSVREASPNGAVYGGAEIAEKQKLAYDIVPLMLTLPPDQVFDNALAAVRALGWNIAATDKEAGLIEASDTTFWYGFSDDIVIRISAADGGSRLDIRSASRVGLSDVGTNAARIKRFFEQLLSDPVDSGY